MIKKMILSLFLTQIIACTAEVGSEKWCKNLEQNPKGDWTVTEAKDYAKHCVFR